MLAQLAGLAEASSASWKVTTKLDAASVAHGSRSTQGPWQLLEVGVQLRTLGNLHAKVFLSDEAFGFVGSANLTAAGLGMAGGKTNIELGVRLDADQRREAAKHFDVWWDDASPVAEHDIKAVEEAAKKLPATVSVPVNCEGSSGDGAGLVSRGNDLLAEVGRVNLWMKALYRDEDSADVPWKGDDWFSSSARGRPFFEIGDLVLIYAKGARRCNSVVQVTDLARHDPAFIVAEGRPQADAERWPWGNRIRPRLQVPAARGVPLSHLGITGQALQSGHERLGQSEFALAVRHLASSDAPGWAPTA